MQRHAGLRVQATRRVWPHGFHAEMEYRLGEKLEVEFRATNTGDVPYPCTELLHPFFDVSHPTNCVVQGVDGKVFYSRANPDWGGFDRIWQGDFPVSLVASGRPGVMFDSGEGTYAIVDAVRSRRTSVAFRGGVKFVVYVAPDGGVSLETGTIYRDRAYVLRPGETHAVGAVVSVGD